MPEAPKPTGLEPVKSLQQIIHESIAIFSEPLITQASSLRGVVTSRDETIRLHHFIHDVKSYNGHLNVRWKTQLQSLTGEEYVAESNKIINSQNYTAGFPRHLSERIKSKKEREQAIQAEMFRYTVFLIAGERKDKHRGTEKAVSIPLTEDIRFLYIHKLPVLERELDDVRRDIKRHEDAITVCEQHMKEYFYPDEQASSSQETE